MCKGICVRGDNTRTQCIWAAVVCFVCTLTLFPTTASAQVLYGSLTGIVTDASNAPVPRATVEAANVGTGIATQAVTDVRGVYLINDLQPGTYRVTISAGSFAPFIEENVGLDANTERRVDAQLKVAQVNQKVTVTAAAEALQMDRTDVKAEISSSQVTGLPLGNDRNWETLYTLLPGVINVPSGHSYAGNPTQGMVQYVNGSGDLNNLTLLDGSIDMNIWTSDAANYVPPSESIEAVNIVTGSFDPEQGNATGRVTNITMKSGTNALHGSAFEYNTISALQSRNYFVATIPKYVLNQFGLSLGGPIKKNKLFFFGDWERYRLVDFASTITSVPTAAIIDGNFSSVSTVIYDPTTGNSDGTGRTAFPNNVIPTTEISSAAAKMAALIPAPNYGGTAAGIANNYLATGDFRFNRDSMDFKVNYVPSSKSTIFWRYSVEPTLIFDPQALGPAGGNALGSTSIPGNARGRVEDGGMGGTYAFSPRLLLDVNMGYSRQGIYAENTDIGTNYGLELGIPGTNGSNLLQGGYPNFELSSLASLGNSSTSSPEVLRNNGYSAAANLSWVRGSHSFRFGMSYLRIDLNHWEANTDYGDRGGFSFTGGVTALKGGTSPNAYNAWADFLLGLPHGLGKDYVVLYPEAYRQSEYAAYARDNWQVTRKLSINYGVRWELYPIPTRDIYGMNNYEINTNTAYLGGEGGVPWDAYMSAGKGQIEPRLGFAYRLNEKTVIRLGYGMSSDPTTPLYMVQGMYPVTISQQISGANSYTPGGSLSAPWVGPTASAGLSAGIPSFPFPNLSLGEFQLPSYIGTYSYPTGAYHRGYEEGWNLTVQRALAKDFNAQIAYVGNHMVRAEANDDLNNAAPGTGNAGTPLYTQYGNASAITYNAPFSGGSYNALQTQLTRRVAGAQVGVSYTYSKAIDDADSSQQGLTWPYGPMWARNKSLAGFDRTHNLQAFAVYNSPFGHGQHWMTNGAGAAILGRWSLSPILSRMSGEPFSVTTSGSSCNCPGNTQTADQILPSVAILGGHGPNEPYFNPLAFAAVTAVRFGTTGRNIVRGPGYFSINASLARTFDLSERFKLEFRMEAYGLTNTANFANPATTVSNATISNGVVTSYGGYDIISSTFQPNGGADRQIRFGLKLAF